MAPNTLQPSRDPYTGWRCHSGAGAILHYQVVGCLLGCNAFRGTLPVQPFVSWRGRGLRLCACSQGADFDEDDTVRHSVLGFLDETCHFRDFVLAETLVHNDEPCHLRVFKLCLCTGADADERACDRARGQAKRHVMRTGHSGGRGGAWNKDTLHIKRYIIRKHYM